MARRGATALPSDQRGTKILMDGDTPAAALLGGAIVQLNDCANVALGIEAHVPCQSRNFAGPQPRFG